MIVTVAHMLAISLQQAIWFVKIPTRPLQSLLFFFLVQMAGFWLMFLLLKMMVKSRGKMCLCVDIHVRSLFPVISANNNKRIGSFFFSILGAQILLLAHNHDSCSRSWFEGSSHERRKKVHCSSLGFWLRRWQKVGPD